jgi:very-short-patch-repair endonuclease
MDSKLSVKQSQEQLLAIVEERISQEPGCVLCGYSMAVYTKTPKLGHWPLEFTKLANYRNQRHGLYRPDSIVMTYRRGEKSPVVYVTSPQHTLLVLAKHEELDSLVVSLSNYLTRGFLDLEKFKKFLDERKRVPYTKIVREALKYASCNDESPLETLVRLSLRDFQYLPFKQQVEVTTPEGDLYRLDFYLEYKGRKIVIEADGFVKYADDTQARAKERKREADLLRMGFEIIRIVWADVTSNNIVEIFEHYQLPKRYYQRKNPKPILRFSKNYYASDSDEIPEIEDFPYSYGEGWQHFKI